MLNPTLSATEIELILVHLKPKLIFADQNLVNVIKNLVEKLHIEILIVEETISYSKNGFSTEYLAEENEFEPIYIDNLEETCTILPITGSNNLLRRNHYHYFHVVSTAITEALHTQNKENIANELHFLNYDTYFSASGLDIFLSIIHGSTNVLCNSRPETFWDLVEKYKISVVFLETSHVEQLMKYKKRGKTDTSSLGRLVVTGSLIPNQYLTALQELIPEAQISALLTNMETGPIITFTKQNLRDAGYVGENLEVVGVPICGIRYKIVNPDSGETLGQYKEGELRVKNKAITEGHDGVYSDKFDDNGWFKTGYKMAYNENCFFFRTKEELSNGLTSTESTVQNSMAEDDPYIVDENHIITIKSRFTPKEGGLGHQIFHSMKNYSDRVAQYLADTEEEDTYQGLLSRCIRLSLNLQSYNLEKDDVIMLCTNNHKNSCVPFLASLFVGVQVASLDPSLSVIETTYLLKEVQPRIIFLSEDSVDLIEESLANAGITPEIIFFGNGTKYRSFEDLLVPHEDEETFSPIFVENLEEPALIVFSSGATGFPKGIVINHYAISCQIGNALDPRQRHCILVYNTLYWISAILICTASILSGGSRVVSHSFDPKEVWHLIDKYRVNGLFLATPAIKSMLTAGRPEDVETSSLSILYCPGVPLPESYIKQLKTVLPKTFVLQSYGQSEVAGSLTQFIGYNKEKTSVVLSKPNSVGLPREGMSYRVVNLETGANCGPNESGELRIKSKIMMNGYYKRDCSETFDEEGWLKTGDIVYYDDDLMFYVVDRVKEVMKYRSWHVAPSLMERVLLDHPTVKQAVVIGIPDPEDGDHPMAIIVPEEKYINSITVDDIAKFAAEKLPDKMQLRGGVKFLDSLPVTPSGKIKRKEIRDMVLNGVI